MSDTRGEEQAGGGRGGLAELRRQLGTIPNQLTALRLAAIPVALAIAWPGYALLSERRGRASEPAPGTGSPRLRQTAAE